LIPGAPAEARWKHVEPRRSLAASVLDRIAEAAFPGRRVVSMEPLRDGLRNANFKLYLNLASEPVVLRIYEHDPSLCRKEADLWRLVRASVPAPEMIYTEQRGWEDLPPFAVLRWIEGITFRELKRTGDRDAITQAAYAAGEMLAAIGRVTFPMAGWIGPGPTVTGPLLEGADPMPRFVDLCLASAELRRHVPAEWRDRTHALVWRWAPQLAALKNETSLVHGDFNKRNLLVRQSGGRWGVVAVLDWEFALAGSPLIDIGNFLRNETAARPLAEPHFSAGFARAGGRLPDDWRRLAQIVELAAICESLSSDHLPDAVIPELVDLLRVTVADP
jgi:aminoglycoside phosphotransferase (APT) family kinase protein